MRENDRKTSLEATAVPKLEFRENSWDFGKIKEGNRVKHFFPFRNNGTSGLMIKDVRTSCCCTAANVSNREILPGKKGKIKVVFNSKGFSEKVNIYINVESNDPAQPLKQLIITADIEGPPLPKISLDRFKQDFGVILENETIKSKVKIQNYGETELTVECRHKDASFFTSGEEVIFPLLVPSGSEIELDIYISTMSRAGFIREYILVMSNDPKRPKLSLCISGYIISRKQLEDLFTKYRNLM